MTALLGSGAHATHTPGAVDPMTDTALQQRIVEELEVVQEFDAAREVERRVAFLADYLRHTHTRGLVLGISGGVDSSVGGRLRQLACAKLRAAGGSALNPGEAAGTS